MSEKNNKTIAARQSPGGYPLEEQNMTHAQKAKQFFLSGCNCSQSVVCAWADELGIDEVTARKISCGLGGGVGRLREICGAVSGAATVISMLYSGEDGRDKATVYGMIQDFAQRFSAETGSVVCRVMLGLDENTPKSPVPEERNEKYYQKRPCTELVCLAAEKLEEVLDEHISHER